MDPLQALGLWASNYAQVFLLGVQSRNVNGGHYLQAGACSLCLAAMQILLIKSQATLPYGWLLLIIGTSGPAGIMSGMWFWKRTVGRKA